MITLSDGTVATVGEEKGKNKLKRFSLETGRELSSTNVKHVYGITEINNRSEPLVSCFTRNIILLLVLLCFVLVTR